MYIHILFSKFSFLSIIFIRQTNLYIKKKKRILDCLGILADGTNKVPEKVRFKERMREW